MSLILSPKLLRALRRVCKLMWPSHEEFRLITSHDAILATSNLAILTPDTAPLRVIPAAGIINEEGALLVHTIRPYMNQCREAAEADELFAEGVWEQISKRGARVIQVDIIYRR